MKKISGFIVIIILMMNLTACGTASDTKVSLTNYCFDTTVTITIYSYSGESDAEDIINGCFGLCNHYESLLSRTIEDSDVSKINNSNGQPTEVQQIVAQIINDSLEYSRLSDGAFDITIAPLTSLWDIKNNTGTIPSDQNINSALKHIDYNTISVDEEFVTLSDKKAQIDLGGIAKGFVADKLKSFMVSEGVTSAIIDLGGNILTIGGKSSSDDFKIGIKKPFSENASDYAATINLSDKSVVTSGIYERYFEKDGKIYHHILDTKTGFPVENNLYSVTIISGTSEAGDALSTSAFALGLDKGKELINSLDKTEAIFITNENKIVLTDGLEINEDHEISFIEESTEE
ncbi:MAG: FAD:protein FMN transferase [Eubacterium sp.]